MKALDQGLTPQNQPAPVNCDYKRKDFNPAAVRKMWHQFDTGMMEEFLAEKDRRYSRYPISVDPTWFDIAAPRSILLKTRGEDSDWKPIKRRTLEARKIGY
jgi:hypothetical protein